DMLEPNGMMALVGHAAAGRPVPRNPGAPPIPHAELEALAPHLYGSRLHQFTDQAHQILDSADPDGMFWDWAGDTEIVVARRRNGVAAEGPK
ncbi:MAG: 3-demethylubiquinone-9 3-methyltransferase protein, partial [Pseudonocardiales bacterium]|nr:3-demethylubiquinone-9 3-methyltransferase protein [Pseudonocardiales bacterium]